MASSETIIKEELKSPPRDEIFQNWKENAPKIRFGEHELVVEIEGVDEYFLQKAKEELRETEEVVVESCKKLRELIAGEPNLNVPDDEDFFKMFLRICKFYPESAFRLMKRYYQFRLNYPHIYKDLLPSKEKTALCANLVYPLPLRAKDGCRILVMETGKRWNPKEVSLNTYFRGLLLLMYIAMGEPKSQIAGGRIIIDAEGLSLTHVTYLTPSFAKMLLEFVQKCLPLRLKSIHIVKQSIFFNMAYAIFKPFLEEKIRKRIHFHGTNWESLMTFIDKEALLKRHGGKLEMPDKSFGEKLWENIIFCEPFIEVDQKCGFIIDNKTK